MRFHYFTIFITITVLASVLSPTVYVFAQEKDWCYRYKDAFGRFVEEECFSSQSTCEKARELEQRGAPLNSCTGSGSVVPQTQGSTPGSVSFIPLQEIEGFLKKGQENKLGDFFNNAFRIGVGVAGILAVIMIIIGGFEYMTSDIPGAKSDGKSKITGAILGIVIILLSGLILTIINPDILSFKFFN